MNKTLRNTLIGVAVIVLLIVLLSLIPDKNYSSKYEGFDFHLIVFWVAFCYFSLVYFPLSLEKKYKPIRIYFHLPKRGVISST